jgi:predicted negative regulator of RcsB-dependent stress response
MHCFYHLLSTIHGVKMSTLIEVSEFDQWFRKNQSVIRKLLIGLIMAGAVYTLYSSRQRSRLDEAATLLAAVQTGDEKNSTTEIQGAAETLKEKYPETHHASIAMLQLARHQAAQAQWKESEASARWVIEHAALPILADQARLHLAQLQVQSKRWDDALNTIKKPMSEETLEPLAAELTADILAIKGDITRARAHYKRALDAQPSGHPYRELLQQKLTTLAP